MKKLLYAFSFSILFILPAHAQIINTVAGDGTYGFTGDGGPATNAELIYPWGIAADNYGNFYMGTDGYWTGGGSSTSRVRRVNAFGTISTYAGNGTAGFSGDGGQATAAEVQNPNGMACDAAGNLYFCDYGNARVRMVNYSTGIITTVAGTGISGYTGDGGAATAAEVDIEPGSGIAVDPTGIIYLVNWGNSVVRKIDGTGTITTFAGNGIFGNSGDGGPATAAEIGTIYGLAADGLGNVYIADFNYNRVRVVNSSGIITTMAGDGGGGFSGDGGAATLAQVYAPIGVAADAAGNVIITQEYNFRARNVNAGGTITTIAGTGSFGYGGDGGPATAATFGYMCGVAVDGGDNVYLADFNNYRYRKILNHNRPPRFTGGHAQYLSVCENTIGDSINSLLAVMDSDIGQTETWSLLTAPHHGTAVILDTTISTGSVLAAHHNYYTPTPGYSGLDTFRVTISDGYAFDTTTIYVTVNAIPATITGGASIATGTYCTVSSGTSGGTWSSSSTAIATVSSAGIVVGVSPGTVTITYTLSTTGCINTTTVNVFTYAGTMITTIAGDGVAGSTGDGGMATAAELHTPFGAAVDAAGNVYIADEINNKVRKVNTSGIISTFAGTGTAGYTGDGSAATAAELSGPYDVAVDGAGNVYIADAGNHRVRVVNSSGVISTFAGNGSGSYSGDGLAATAAGLGSPSGIAIDGSGNFYICADGVHVRKVNTAGIISTFAGSSTGFSGDGGPATAAQLSNPVSVAADPSGNILIADQFNNRIRIVNLSGTISTIAGNGTGGYVSDGVPATTAEINNPWGITEDALGNIYIGDHLNNRVRKVNTAGVISTVAGNGTAGFAGDGCAASASQINSHWGICTDGLGNVYIADGGNNRVRKIYSNHAPEFVGGHNQSSSVCENSVDSINSLMAITDPDFSQSETWTVIIPPLNGTVVAAYSGTSDGGIVTPSGLYYTPTIGFTGTDSFTVRVYDCGGGSDTTKIHVTVTPPPSSITGASTVCTGLSTTLVDLVGTGVWSSSSTATATVGVSTGVVTGVTTGPVTITYSPGAGCSVTKGVTVVASPAAISGSHNICLGTPTTYTDATPGGVWSSSNPSIATVGSTGLVTGVSAGAVTITYSEGGCYVLMAAIVNPYTPTITGINTTCIGVPDALFDFGGGVWSSIGPSIATVDSFTGIVVGISTGSTTISYTLATGCAATMLFTVLPPVSAITGPLTVCVGQTITLTDTTFGGVWRTTGLGTSATIDSITGILTGVSTGIENIAYVSLLTGCAANTVVTVNPSPSPITGPDSVCIGTTTTLTDLTSGATWSSGATSIATVGSSGVVTGIAAGTAAISCGIVGCYATTVVTVDPLPRAISGSSSVCVGLTATLTDPSGTSTWSSGSPIIASVGPSTGVVTGLLAGVANITYTSHTGGCIATKAMTVNNSPGAITGSLQGCIGGTIALGNPVSGGTWSSGTPAVGTISSSGVVSGLSPGTTLITYSLGAGCSATATVTVNSLPPVIGGSPEVCVGSTTTLTDGTHGGTWSTSGTAGTVGSISGVVTGVSSGLSVITYTAGGCPRNITVTVNPLPSSIGGPSTVCIGSTISLTDISIGGAWSSALTGTATVGSTGIVTGAGLGAVTILYTLPTGCATTTIITVDALPPAISGPGAVCQGSNITLTDIIGGGTWSTAGGIAGVGGTTGIVTGISAGTATISYTLSLTTGCTITRAITVNPLPTITGPTTVCVGATMSEVSTPGGLWVSGTTGIATIGSSSGVVTGVATGTSAITYTSPAGCVTNETVTVSLSPTTIIGPSAICNGVGVTYTDGVGGGTWSGGGSVATVGSLSGLVTGYSAGPATITYSLGTGCTTYLPITINATPAPIGGATGICAGNTATLTETSGGGVWSSGSTAIATVGSGSGVVTGTGAGTATISYTVRGCSSTAIMTINATPSAIAGPTLVCAGTTITETNSVSGGTWSTSGTAISIGSLSGVVMGMSGGTAPITYAIGSCIATRVVSVNSAPAITGATGVCTGTTTTLSAPGGGTWTSSSPGIATIGSATGTLTGIAPGSSLITYSTGTGCTATTTVTVNTGPGAIVGPFQACTGATIPLTDTRGGGLWSSGSTTVATIGSSSGIVMGVIPGTSLITYSLGTGCTVTATVTVSASPSSITGSTQMCAGSSTSLSSTTSGGLWTSNSISTASVGSTTGFVSGVSAGTATISYTVGGACYVSTVVTVNPLPSPISGVPQICAGTPTAFTVTTSGGAWSSSSTTIATIGSSSGIITGGTPGAVTVTYALPTGCLTSTSVTVNAAPASILGATAACPGSSANLTDATTGGSWTSGAVGIATIGSSTGTVGAVTVGTAPITYTVSGCAAMTTFTVTPLPVAIGGTSNVCAGATTTLSDVTFGGTWSSGSPGIATIGSATGTVSGITPGTTTITYSLGAGCTVNMPVSVSPAPPAIVGSPDICLYASETLTDHATGGAWSSTNPAIAPITTTGVVSGIAGGTATISYTSTIGCAATLNVNVITVPAPTPTISSMCAWGDTIRISDIDTTGLYTSTLVTVTNLGDGQGMVTSVAPGLSSISYTLPSGCSLTVTLTTNPLPGLILGVDRLCTSASTSLTNSVAGGLWSSASPGIASVGSLTGVVTGLSTGSAHIIYTLPTGCLADTSVTVVLPPSAITGAANMCAGTTVTLSDLVSGGTWTSSTPGIAAVGSLTGIVAGTSAGTATITYSILPSCFATTVVTTEPLPVPYTVTGGGNYCAGAAGEHVGLGGSGSGIQYQLYRGATTVGATVPGTGSTLDFGLQTTAGTYTVSATDATTGCGSSMTGSVTIVITPTVTPTVSITVTPGTSLCAGATANFAAAPINGGTTPAYQWSVNGVIAALSGSTYSYIPLNGDRISVLLSSDAVCAVPNTATGEVTMTVTEPATPVVTISAVPGTTIYAGQYDTLTATIVSGGGASPLYQWEVNSAPVAGANTANWITDNLVNGDSVKCTVTNTDPCGETATQWLVMTVKPDTSISTAAVKITGTDDVINVLPNPNKGIFLIKGTLGSLVDEEVTIEVTDMIGQQVYSNTVIAKGGILNEEVTLAGKTASATYLLTVHTASGNKVFHIVVE